MPLPPRPDPSRRRTSAALAAAVAFAGLPPPGRASTPSGIYATASGDCASTAPIHVATSPASAPPVQTLGAPPAPERPNNTVAYTLAAAACPVEWCSGRRRLSSLPQF